VPGRCRVTAVSTQLFAARSDPRPDAAQASAGLPKPGGRRGSRGDLVGRPRHTAAAFQRAERAPRDRDRCRLAYGPRKIDTQPRLAGSRGPIDETAGSLRGLCRWLVRGNPIGRALSAWTRRATICPSGGQACATDRRYRPLRYTRNVFGDAVAEHVLIRVARSWADYREGA